MSASTNLPRCARDTCGFPLPPIARAQEGVARPDGIKLDTIDIARQEGLSSVVALPQVWTPVAARYDILQLLTVTSLRLSSWEMPIMASRPSYKVSPASPCLRPRSLGPVIRSRSSPAAVTKQLASSSDLAQRPPKNATRSFRSSSMRLWVSASLLGNSRTSSKRFVSCHVHAGLSSTPVLRH
jgi:hypothetical protein